MRNLFGALVFGELPYINGFYLQEPYQVLTEETRKIWKWKGKSNCEMYMSVFHDNGLLSRGKDFTRDISHLGEGHFPTAVPSSLPVSTKSRRN